jgi:hypothetical protein
VSAMWQDVLPDRGQRPVSIGPLATLLSACPLALPVAARIFPEVGRYVKTLPTLPGRLGGDLAGGIDQRYALIHIRRASILLRITTGW